MANPLHKAGRSGTSVTHSKEHALSDSEFEMLLEGSRNLKRSDYYYTPDPEFIIVALGRLGMRRGELVHMKESWIDWRNKMIFIPSHEPCDFGKGGEVCGYCCQMAKQRAEYADDELSYEEALEWVWTPKTQAAAREIYFGFDPRIEMYIKRYFENDEYNRVEVSGTAVNRRVKKSASYVDEINENMIYPHALRATAATYHAARGLEMLSLMQYMGWCQPSTAEVYIGRNGKNTKRQLDAIHS